jgi:hypothetical protein
LPCAAYFLEGRIVRMDAKLLNVQNCQRVMTSFTAACSRAINCAGGIGVNSRYAKTPTIAQAAAIPRIARLDNSGRPVIMPCLTIWRMSGS